MSNNNFKVNTNINIDITKKKNKKLNFSKLIQYQQINFNNNKYIKTIQYKFTEKYNKEYCNDDFCIEDHTFKYYPFVNNGTCRFCLKRKPKSEKELLNESYNELFN